MLSNNSNPAQNSKAASTSYSRNTGAELKRSFAQKLSTIVTLGSLFLPAAGCKGLGIEEDAATSHRLSSLTALTSFPEPGVKWQEPQIQEVNEDNFREFAFDIPREEYELSSPNPLSDQDEETFFERISEGASELIDEGLEEIDSYLNDPEKLNNWAIKQLGRELNRQVRRQMEREYGQGWQELPEFQDFRNVRGEISYLGDEFLYPNEGYLEFGDSGRDDYDYTPAPKRTETRLKFRPRLSGLRGLVDSSREISAGFRLKFETPDSGDFQLRVRFREGGEHQFFVQWSMTF